MQEKKPKKPHRALLQHFSVLIFMTLLLLLKVYLLSIEITVPDKHSCCKYFKLPICTLLPHTVDSTFLSALFWVNSGS